MTRDDWPLGIALKGARERAGLSVRAAARRTKGAISSGRWYQLESGYQKAGGHSIPIGTTASTVAAAVASSRVVYKSGPDQDVRRVVAE